MLIEEARRQMEESGYGNMTIRSIAGACGLGVGTVYNYFVSKDMLVASVLLTDWQRCMGIVNDCCGQMSGHEAVFRCIYDQLKGFLHQYERLFTDAEAMKVFTGAFSQRHKQLRDQLAEPVGRLEAVRQMPNGAFLAEFIAESLLTWTVAGKSYEEIAAVLRLIINK